MLLPFSRQLIYIIISRLLCQQLFSFFCFSLCHQRSRSGGCPDDKCYDITAFGNCQYCFCFLFISDNSHNFRPVQPCASNRNKNNWELAHIVVLFLFEAYGALPKREVAVAQRIRAVWLNCNKFTPFHNVPKCRILPRCCLWEGTRIRTATIPFSFLVCFHSFCP